MATEIMWLDTTALERWKIPNKSPTGTSAIANFNTFLHIRQFHIRHFIFLLFSVGNERGDVSIVVQIGFCQKRNELKMQHKYLHFIYYDSEIIKCNDLREGIQQLKLLYFFKTAHNYINLIIILKTMTNTINYLSTIYYNKYFSLYSESFEMLKV